MFIVGKILICYIYRWCINVGKFDKFVVSVRVYKFSNLEFGDGNGSVIVFDVYCSVGGIGSYIIIGCVC